METIYYGFDDKKGRSTIFSSTSLFRTINYGLMFLAIFPLTRVSLRVEQQN